MAGIYTYKDFENTARQNGLYEQFSDADLRLAQMNPDAGMSLLTYKQQWKNATTEDGKALAHSAAENIRKQYGGYAGGTAGRDFTKITEPVASVKPFEYDAANDPVYTQYRKQYLREGKRATEDTMGAAAAMTGGIPSSFAVTAAGQAGNYYNAQLTDKIPELYEAAYNRYLNEFSMQQQARESALQEAQVGAQYGDYTGLNNMGIDTSNNPADYEKKLNEAMLAAQYGDYSKLQAMGIDTSGNSADYEKKLNEAMLAAQYGDYSKLQALGIDISNADYEKKLNEAMLAAQYGDYSKLRALGIISGTSGGAVSGGSSVRYSDRDYNDDDGGQPPQPVTMGNLTDRGYPSSTEGYQASKQTQAAKDNQNYKAVEELMKGYQGYPTSTAAYLPKYS